MRSRDRHGAVRTRVERRDLPRGMRSIIDALRPASLTLDVRIPGTTSCADGCWDAARPSGRVGAWNEHPTRPDGLWERSSLEVEGDRLPGQHVIRSFSEFLLDRATIASILGLVASDLAARSSASRILNSSWSIVLLRVCLTFEFSSRRRRSAGTRG